MKSQSDLSKALEKSKEITTRDFLSVFERSGKSRIMESVCNIVLLW